MWRVFDGMKCKPNIAKFVTHQGRKPAVDGVARAVGSCPIPISRARVSTFTIEVLSYQRVLFNTFWLGELCQSLGRTKYWHAYGLASTTHCIGQTRIQIVSTISSGRKITSVRGKFHRVSDWRRPLFFYLYRLQFLCKLTVFLNETPS